MDEELDRGSRELERPRPEGRLRQQLLHGDTTNTVLAAFYRVYRELGGGFVESVYARALRIELVELGAKVDAECAVTVLYRGHEVGFFRVDFVVDDRVLVEIKAVAGLVSTHQQQVLNYLAATNLEVALLLNFGPKAEFRRMILTQNNKRL